MINCILLDCSISEFNKLYIEKNDANALESAGYRILKLEKIHIDNIIKLMKAQCFKYCYDIDSDEFFEISDLAELV